MTSNEEQVDTQARAEWDRILDARLLTELAPHFIKDKAGAVECLAQVRAAIECLYDGNIDGWVTASWREVALIMRLVNEIQAQCADKDHALEVLRLVGFTLEWQYQPGVQGKAPYEGYLRVVSANPPL